MLIFEDISKYFGNTCAIKNINLTIDYGDIFALLGPNGAGKSTILGIISGLIRPSSGTLSMNGKFLSEGNNEISRKAGVVFENPSFYDYLSGKENIIILSKLKGHYDKKEISDLFEKVSLSEKLNKPVREYSLGMKQRLALAAALINDPDILLLDEPTNGLDPEGIDTVLSILKSFVTKGEKIIIISSHQIYDVESLCSKVAIIKEGKIICQGGMKALLGENFKPNLKDFYVETIKGKDE